MKYDDWTQRRAMELKAELGTISAQRQALADALHRHLREHFDYEDKTREMFVGLLEWLNIEES